jgi:hypothetical protein
VECWNNDTPHILYKTLRSLKKGEELLLNWGSEFWKNIARIENEHEKRQHFGPYNHIQHIQIGTRVAVYWAQYDCEYFGAVVEFSAIKKLPYKVIVDFPS